MATVLAWAVFILGVTHVLFGVIRFRAPLAEAIADGFYGQFKVPEIRRTAFWFLMCGPLLMLAGHLAIRAAASGDLATLKVVGIYGFVSALVGVAAFPKSPLWALLLLSPLLVAAGYGIVS
jgi:hypothetical protein